ncbi:hypothetical protein GE061_017100 [Apolygus lucorum]|uniref:U3 small nucleolar RNA-associated protein 25 homolog n=1 Tax=Apolygus lucorum TaxID=248454 RepID=A0A8S9XI20_APOLU|nr:hypothetical protein GE061_017100 [Apolygus lucorum]
MFKVNASTYAKIPKTRIYARAAYRLYMLTGILHLVSSYFGYEDGLVKPLEIAFTWSYALGLPLLAAEVCCANGVFSGIATLHILIPTATLIIYHYDVSQLDVYLLGVSHGYSMLAMVACGILTNRITPYGVTLVYYFTLYRVDPKAAIDPTFLEMNWIVEQRGSEVSLLKSNHLNRLVAKLYSDFYTSDIIIASPLALRMLIGSEGERNRQFDFLASIEVLVMDLTHVMVMQNWEHVLHVINHLHLQPKDSHGTDLSRVRMWALNGCSRYYMQSMVFSSCPMPEITALFNSKFANFAGKVTVVNPVMSGSMSQVALQVPQVFHHVKSATVSQAVDDRFETFISDILPQYKDTSMKHTLIYVPSYFDFVRLRNYLKKQEYKFVHICEYTEEKKIIRARNKIFHGETQILLYTERFHFYRRLKLRGIQNIIFYQPPAFPNFYSELCNFLQDVNKIKNVESEGEAVMTVNVLYTKFDVTQVAAIVGTDRATRMLASDKPTHMFMTDT